MATELQETTKTRVLLTGATGNMGREVMRHLAGHRGSVALRILAHPDEHIAGEVSGLVGESGAEVVRGDLTRFPDVLHAVTGSDWVLHVGGLVSPMADRFPDLTHNVNVGGTTNVVNAIRAQADPDAVKLVYIGTVAQTGSRMPPIHWGRTGDPIKISRFDHYAVSKTRAEAVVAESGLKHWVSLRQTGIAHVRMWKVFDPIMFHNPINGVFEWVTAGDSGRLLAGLCTTELPDDFWRRFYNIGGGPKCRVVNHQFMRAVFSALGVRDYQEVVEPNWFATRNFHGQWYSDSERLQQLVPFQTETISGFMAQLTVAVPGFVRLLGRCAPSLVRKRIHALSRAEGGSMHWVRNDKHEQIDSYFGSRSAWESIPGWNGFAFASPSDTPSSLEHGLDKPLDEAGWSLADMRRAADFRGGRCLSTHMEGPCGKLDWQCPMGHEFRMSPNLMMAGGHWCPTCMVDPDCYPAVAARSPYFRQVWQEVTP